MIKNFKIITLCGSTKFKDDYIAMQKKLTLDGNIVISVGLFGHKGDQEVWTTGTKEMLDAMHLAKIDLADEIFVINTNGYIGESTKNEIRYAIKTGKPVKFMIQMNDVAISELLSYEINSVDENFIENSFSDEIKPINKDSVRKYIKELQDKIDKLIIDYELTWE